MRWSRRAGWWPAALLVPLCAALYLPGLFALPPIDRDEARYAQAARQMLESGDLTIPHLQSAARLIKPAGAYWLQAAAVRLADATPPAAIGVHRLPSVLGALAAVLATYAIGRRWFAPRVAWLGAALLAVSALLVVEAHLATTDAALLACVVAAQACLASLYTAARRGRPGSAAAAAGFWLAQGAGILMKGPIAPLVSALTIAALLAAAWVRRWRGAPAVGGSTPPGLLSALRLWWGVPLLVACLAPWVVLVALRADWRALPAAMASDIAPKLLGGHESHGAPPGYYSLIVPATFWPGSMALVFALALGWRRRHRPAESFLLAWLVPTWLLFECLPTKLPHYVLPAFPALALLAARAALTAPAKLRPPLAHPVTRALLLGWALLTAACGIAPAMAAHALAADMRNAAVVLPALAAAGLAAFVLRQSWRGRFAAAAWTSALGAVLVYGPLLEWVLPRLDALWLSRAAAAAVDRAGTARPLAAVGYGEPSIVFLTRSDVALLDPDGAAAFLAERPHGLVLVETNALAPFSDAAQRRGIQLRNLWSQRAFNYTKGRWVELQLFAGVGPH